MFAIGRLDEEFVRFRRRRKIVQSIAAVMAGLVPIGAKLRLAGQFEPPVAS
jgi:hypothetical protein